MIFNKYELNKLVGCKHLSKSEPYKYYTSPITENSEKEISTFFLLWPSQSDLNVFTLALLLPSFGTR